MVQLQLSRHFSPKEGKEHWTEQLVPKSPGGQALIYFETSNKWFTYFKKSRGEIDKYIILTYLTFTDSIDHFVIRTTGMSFSEMLRKHKQK